VPKAGGEQGPWGCAEHGNTLMAALTSPVLSLKANRSESFGKALIRFGAIVKSDWIGELGIQEGFFFFLPQIVERIW